MGNLTHLSSKSIRPKTVEIGYDQKVKKVNVGEGHPLALIGGPCAIESRDHAFFMAESIGKIVNTTKIAALRLKVSMGAVWKMV